MGVEDEPSYFHHWRKTQWQTPYLQWVSERYLAKGDAERFLESCKGWKENYWDSPNCARGVELPCKDGPRWRVKEWGIEGEGFKALEQLPQEVRRKIIEIAILEEVKARVDKYTHWYGLRTWREFGKEEVRSGPVDTAVPMKGDVEELWRKRVLRRGEVVRVDCLGSLLGTSRRVREVVLSFLGERAVGTTEQGKMVGAFWRARKWDGVVQERGCGWDVVVRSGKGQSGRTSNRRDVRRWRTVKYVFEGCSNALGGLEVRDEGSVQLCTSEEKAEVVETETLRNWAIMTPKNRLLEPERELTAWIETQTEEGEKGSTWVSTHSKPRESVETSTPIYASMTSSRDSLSSPPTCFSPALVARTEPEGKFCFFPRLPTELQVLIIAHAFHNSIESLYHSRELLHHCNQSKAWRAKRYELLSPFACGGLLAVSKLFLAEILQALQPHLKYGKPWSSSRSMRRKRDFHRWRSAVYMFDEPTVLSNTCLE